MKLSGSIVSGGGRHAGTQEKYGDVFERVLGYRPYLGSLNVLLDERVAPLLVWGPPKHVVQTHLTNALWPVEIEGYDGPAHVLVWRRPSAFAKYVELLAPVRLRDLGHLGDRVTLWRV